MGIGFANAEKRKIFSQKQGLELKTGEQTVYYSIALEIKKDYEINGLNNVTNKGKQYGLSF